MSGIAGVYYLDGRPVGKELDRMVDVMEHRGPDGADTWRDRSVGLGHLMLETTPEDQYESLPLVDQSGHFVITADARIDNRDELLRTLDLRASENRPVTDTELILAAYKRWGWECAKKLLGAFVFAVWDKREQMLVLGRDHFGIKQLYFYHQGPQIFALASEIKGLLALPVVPEEIDELILGEYLASAEPHAERTLFQDILRVPPGHTLTVTPSGMHRRQYWSLSPASVSSNLSDEEYAERFRELFSEAVGCRMRSDFPVGAELSGGLDSSYVACAARQHLREAGEENVLHAFSTVYNRFDECDERPYIREVLEDGGIVPHYIPVEKQGIPTLLEEIYDYLDDGRVSGNHHLNWLTAREAGRSPVRVLLTGQDGDSTVYHGWEYFAQLARNRQWEKFAKLANQCIQVLQRDPGIVERQEPWTQPREILGSYASTYLRRWAKEGNYWKLFTSLVGINNHFSVSPWLILRNLAPEVLLPSFYWDWRKENGEGVEIPSIIDSEFANEIGLAQYLLTRSDSDTQQSRDATVREAQEKTLNSSYLISSFEKIAHYAAASGVEARHPFMDKRLVEFCLGLPSDQSLAEGWSRVIMRRAMKGTVPEAIRCRTEKASLAAPFRHLLVNRGGTKIDHLLEDMGEIEKYVDKSELLSTYEKLDEERSVPQDQIRAFASVTSLACWCRERGMGSSVPVASSQR